MFYVALKDAPAEDFKRATGVSDFMFFTLLQAYQTHHPRTAMGRPRRLSREDELLLALMYWREYRSHFHIAQTYRISEATARRVIRQVEDALMRDPLLHLPGKKRLLTAVPDETVPTVIVDATECPVERPQKNRSSITVGRRNDTPRKRS